MRLWRLRRGVLCLSITFCLPKILFNHTSSWALFSHIFPSPGLPIVPLFPPHPSFSVLCLEVWESSPPWGRLFHPNICVWDQDNERQFPFVFMDLLDPLLYSPFTKMSSFISQDSLQQTKTTDSSWQPALSLSLLVFLLLLSNLSQTYQQSSSLQSKSRKKNKGKQENHLFSFTSCRRVSRNCYHSHTLASCGHSLLHSLSGMQN